MTGFELEGFLPYILNQTAEAASKGFEPLYRDGFGMTRTQWRVLALIGRYPGLSARDICALAHEEKSRVSRAIAALETDGLIARDQSEFDRRSEILRLTPEGATRYATLGAAAQAYDQGLRDMLGQEDAATLRVLLSRLQRAVRDVEPQ